LISLPVTVAIIQVAVGVATLILNQVISAAAGG